MKCLACICALLLTTLSTTALAQDPVLTQWVESNPGNDPAKLGLGYPVPIPVDSPVPFDGFRTYMGLRTRHLDLVATTPWAHPEAIGTSHQGRTIWAYRLGDGDMTTPWGLPEPATLTNGGIHAREWQTPETVTGIMELLATHESDQHFYDYLREHVNMVVIPVLNVDGFNQTQRAPDLSWVGLDPDVPDEWPRDGRMRRKNMLNADEDFYTTDDHLNGVDLNRNNNPYWDTTNQIRSSDNVHSLVHHGQEPASEPEIQALDAAAQLGPADQLRLYTDVHSFSQVHFWVGSSNTRLTRLTEDVLGTFTGHHISFDAGKWYAFLDRNSVAVNQGIGSTDEYFTHIYKVPSWTLEIEPSGGQSFHQPLPGSGADYGGTGVTHSGFVLPESEITRVREELAQSFAAVYYRQAGPPHIQAMRFTDQITGAVVFEAEWDMLDEQNREMYVNQVQPMVLGRKYQFWLAFSKPMRWIENGNVTTFPGQFAHTLDVDADILVGAAPVDAILDDVGWALEPGGAPDGFMRYSTDAMWAEFSFQDSQHNRDLYANDEQTTLRIKAFDMTGTELDSDPATAVYWKDGNWHEFENSIGQDSDFGGRDATMNVTVTSQILPDPFVIEPGIASAWVDPDHVGEGFVVEILAGNRAVVYWFTYDDEGNQDWYIGVGEIRGNRLMFPDLLRLSGGEFGPGFDPAKVTSERVGSAKFLWSGCEDGYMDWHIGNRRGRQQMVRLSNLMGLECGIEPGPPVREEALYNGAWYDPTHNGEGYTVEILSDERVLVYWFSFGPDGARRWYFGVGKIENGKLVIDDMLTTRGGIFGNDFDPDTVEVLPWGTLELDIDCDGGTATYASTEEGFGSGQLNVEQLTSMDGLECP